MTSNQFRAIGGMPGRPALLPAADGYLISDDLRVIAGIYPLTGAVLPRSQAGRAVLRGSGRVVLRGTGRLT